MVTIALNSEEMSKLSAVLLLLLMDCQPDEQQTPGCDFVALNLLQGLARKNWYRVIQNEITL